MTEHSDHHDAPSLNDVVLPVSHASLRGLDPSQRVPASDIPHCRRKFYTDTAAVLVLDQRFFAETVVPGHAGPF